MALLKTLDATEESDKFFLDFVNFGVIAAAFAELVPVIAAVFSIIWAGIRIYETDTVQKVLNRKKKKDREKDL